VKERDYDPEVLTSLAALTELATGREQSVRLEAIAKVVNRWKRKRLEASEALEEIRRAVAGVEAAWSQNADPGVPVAHAVAVGLLEREEIPEGVWESIEVLVTLAEI
jgi:hypothetical protein